MPNPVCTSLGIPEHLHQDDRLADPTFEPAEVLYRRFLVSGRIEEWLKNNSLSSAVFQIKNDSFNRSKYSEANDVLYNDIVEENGNHYNDSGILQVPSSINDFDFQINQNKTLRQFTVRVVHTPRSCNYSHSEVFLFENGVQINSNKPST